MNKISNSFLLTDKFVRTDVEFDSRVKPHNRKRTEWIGEGKTFFDMYKQNSTYRKNIKRDSYSGNETMIDQDVKWDLKHKWIKKVKTKDQYLRDENLKTLDQYMDQMNFKKIGKFYIRNKKFIVEYDQKYSTSEKMIYIHVIDNEIVRVGSSKNKFKYRMERWEKDITRVLNNKKHDTPVNEGDEWTNLLNNRIGTLYGRRGTSINTPVGEINIYLSEESYLIGKHQPIMCKDKSRYKWQGKQVQPIQFRYGGVDLNSALKRRNFGSIWNTRVCVWTDSIYSGSKTNKQTKRKRNSRRGLQGRLMHQTNQLNHRRIDENKFK